MNAPLLSTALAYHHAGLTVLPNDPARKYPAGLRGWETVQVTEEQVQSWFSNGTHAIGVRDVEGLDFDNKGTPDAETLYGEWFALVESIAPGLADRLLLEQTPSGGFHAVWRCEVIDGNQKLATRPPTAQELKDNPKATRTTLIETRGRGGQFQVAPSPGYTLLRGDWTALPIITEDERQIILDCARALTQSDRPTLERVSAATGERPGDLYNQYRGHESLALLESYGWRVILTRGMVQYLCRPGKAHGVSASYGHIAPNVLYVFSSNASPFEPERAYSPFAVYTLLEHNGDYKRAAGALRGAQRTVNPETGEIIDRTPAKSELVRPDSFEAFLAKPVDQSGYAVPITAAQLAQKEIPPTRYFIQDMLRPGLALFVGNPGIGKTPALIQLALAFATGNKWLGSIDVLKCQRVLYIGVEYDEAYIKETAIASYGSSKLPENLLFLSVETFTPPKTEEESMQMLEYYITVYGVDVVIIDVFSGFLPREKFKQDKYRGDYAEFLMYQKLFMFHKALLVGSWHGGKHAKDPETAYNGGQGMWGSAGGGRLTMIFDDENQVRFRSQLRGHERKEWVLEQARIDGAHFWAVVDADPDPIFGSDAQRRIFSAIKRHSTAREPLSPQGVKAILAADAPELGLKDSYIRQTLSRLEDRGLLMKWNGGYIIQRGSLGSRGSDDVRGSRGSRGSLGSPDESDPSDPPRSNSAIHDISRPDAELGGAIQAIQQNQRSNDFASDPTDFWAPVPAAQQTIIRLYLRSNKATDQARAHELCEQYGLDYEEAKRYANS